MPSLHAGWIFVVFLNLRYMPRKLYWSAWFLVIFTLIGALQTGHYFIDFLPSVPLAVGSAALAARPGTLPIGWRLGGAVACYLGAIAYLVLLRVWSPVLVEHAWLNVASQIGILGFGICMDRLLLRKYREDMVEA